MGIIQMSQYCRKNNKRKLFQNEGLKSDLQEAKTRYQFVIN